MSCVVIECVSTTELQGTNYVTFYACNSAGSVFIAYDASTAKFWWYNT